MSDVAPTLLALDIVAKQLKAFYHVVEDTTAIAFAPFDTLATLAMLATVASEPTKTHIIHYLCILPEEQQTILKYYKDSFHKITESLKETSKHTKKPEIHLASLLLEKSYSWSNEAIETINDFFETKACYFVEFQNESDNVILSKCNDQHFSHPLKFINFMDRTLGMLGQAACKLSPKLILDNVENSFVTTSMGFTWYHCLTAASYSRTEQVSMVNIRAEGDRIVSFVKPAAGITVKELINRWGTHQFAEWIARRGHEKPVNLRIPLCAVAGEFDFLNSSDNDPRLEDIMDIDLADFSQLCESNCVTLDGLASYARIQLFSPTPNTDLPNPESSPIPEQMKATVPGFIDFKIKDSFIVLVCMAPPTFNVLAINSFDSIKTMPAARK
uniref:SERPIN domain-containing protein n=1 Tax=Panagrellus redivivus TaxID=6233 RepID=A0A7E4WCE4_PANRE